MSFDRKFYATAITIWLHHRLTFKQKIWSYNLHWDHLKTIPRNRKLEVTVADGDLSTLITNLNSNRCCQSTHTLDSSLFKAYVNHVEITDTWFSDLADEPTSHVGIHTHTVYLEITTKHPTNTPIPMGIHLSFFYLHSGNCSELNSVPQNSDTYETSGNLMKYDFYFTPKI